MSENSQKDKKHERYVAQSKVISQEKLKSLNVAVVGAGVLSHYILTNFCGLGVGNIHIFGNDVPSDEGKFLFSLNEHSNESSLAALEEILNRINPLNIKRHDCLPNVNLS